MVAFLQRLALIIAITITVLHLRSQACLLNCGTHSIQYPWGIDYGCGDPSFHGLLVCKLADGSASELDLFIPSGSYQVRNLDYSNRTIDIVDSSLLSCDQVYFHKERNFTLPASAPLQLSRSNHFLFFACAANATISSKYSTCINNSLLCTSYLSWCFNSIHIPDCCEHGAEAYDTIDVSTLHCDYTSFYSDVSSINPQQWPFGFQLKFLQNDSRAAACNLCVASGGVCGYNSTYPFICMCKESNSTTDCSVDCGGGACGISDANHKAIIIGVVIATVAIICFSLMAWYWRCWSSRPANRFLQPLKGMNDSPIEFTFKELTEATDNFREKLGSGGYASVYKGVLVNGSIVAVKKLSANLRQAAKVFRAEVSTLGSINHFNLVKLIGYCSKNSERLLVYEYMTNGSLDRFLYNPNADVFLDWNKRIEIALGAARGIAYLHEGSRMRIMHCDIKPANILLDDNFTAKVADFGLAKLMKEREQNQMHSAAIKGTPGYIAPEWIKRAASVTEKSDVYSFGMVLLEIFGGRKNADPAAQSSSHFLLSTWATEAAQRNDFKAILDPRLNGDADDDQAARFIGVAILCIQNDPVPRPSMKDVVKMLEGTMQVTQPLPIFTTSCQTKVNANTGYTSGGILDSYDKAVSAR